jgi:hypothetical protein
MMRGMRTLLILAVLSTPAFADKELAKGTTWDCKKDPVVSIGNGAGKYTFKGACKKISIGGGSNKVTIASVETLDVGGGMNTINVTTVDALVVGGAGNKITAGTVDTIDVGGASNEITWKKAKTGDKPNIKGQPDMNKISQK